MQHPAPSAHNTRTEPNANTHGQRIRSFNIEDFNDLVSTALGMQRLPDSSLAFSLKATANTRSPRTRQASTDTIQPSNMLRSFKDALRRKGVAENASERGTATRHLHLSRLSGTRNLASSSVPALPPTISHSGRIPYSPSLTDVDEYDSDASGSDPLTSAPETPATPFGLFHAFPRDPWSQQEFIASDTPHQSYVPHDRARTKSTHKNFFKSLPFSKLKRKPSRLLFTSGSPPSPSILGTPPDSLPARESEISHSESDGMRSFFDDSGFEEPEVASFKSVRKANSRPRIRHFFSAPSTVFDSSLLETNQDVQYRASKPLPPTPTTPSSEPELQARDGVMVAQVPILSELTPTSATGKIQVTRHEYASPFYAPPSLPHRPAPRPRKVLQEKDVKGRVGLRHLSSHERSPFQRLSRSMDLVHVPARIRNRHSPSPFPSPTSPLPPTPDMLPSQLRTKSSMNSFRPFDLDQETNENMSCESADQSIDSIEILSWRTKGLQKRSSKTSSGSAHARGKPSRNSIRERFGLGPQLHIHVSGPEAGQSQILANDNLEGPYVRTRTTSTLTLRPTSRVNTSTEVSTVRTLTSMSVLSLRDSSNGCNQTSSNTSDTGCYFDAFDLEEDPFAADPLSTPPTIPTPISPSGGQSPAQSMKLRSFMPLGNDSKPGTPEPPYLWSSLLRLRQSSPSLATSRVTVSPGLPGYSSSSVSCTSVASPSSVRSGLPPSLVDALGTREGTPSPSGSPRRPNLSFSLNQLLLRTKGSQRFRKDSAISKLSQVSEGSIGGGSPGIAGHSDSRPHSPFPLLFFRSAASKPSPITKEACLGSVSPEITVAVGDLEMHPPFSPVFPVRELQPISAQDADAFGDACKRYSEFSLGRPLGISTHVPPFKELSEDLTSKAPESENSLRLTFNSMEIEPDSTKSSADHVGANEEKSCSDEAEVAVADTNEDVRVNKQAWPLPPLRTVVLDEENGEGWHDVDQMIEHVSLHATIPDVPRHTIRLPTTYRSGSYRSSSSKGSSSGSSRSRRLDAQQARKIIETISHKVEHHLSPSSLTSPAEDQSIPFHRRSLSVDSELSFLSSDTGSQSTKTCGSAYYSIQSSYSLRSKKSYSKSATLRRAMLLTNSSPATPTSSQRPGSGRGAKSPTPSSFSRDRSASFGSSVISGSPTSIKVSIANKRMNPDALPRWISLRDGNLMNTMTIAAEGWTRLMGFCSQHDSFCIEAGKDIALLWISIEEVVLASEDTEFYMPAIRGNLPASNIHVLMTLTLNAPKQEEPGRDTPVFPRNPDLTFCLPLPTTLGEIAEHSRRSSVGEDFAGL